MSEKGSGKRRNLGMKKGGPRQKLSKNDTDDELSSSDQPVKFKNIDKPCFSSDGNMSSESDDFKEGTVNFSIPNLKVSGENYTKIDSFVQRTKPKLQARESLRGRLHGLMFRLNKKQRPKFPEISGKPPMLPRGASYPSEFEDAYMTKALLFQRKLGIMIAKQYHSTIEQLTTEIDSIEGEAKRELGLIPDEKERAKALRLFVVKVNAAQRRHHRLSRHHFQPSRQHHKHFTKKAR